MGVTTWLDRITDESNLWLSAAKAEEAKDYATAAVQYLGDAGVCLERGSKVRAALSCFCAAECLSAMDGRADAKRLYHQAGKLYFAIADHGVSGSIREALWALQRTYACYVQAEQVKESEAINEAFKHLARRANPFSGEPQWLEMPKFVPKEWAGAGEGAQVPREAKEAVDEFLVLCGATRASSQGQNLKPRRTGGMVDDQESFISQLG